MGQATVDGPFEAEDGKGGMAGDRCDQGDAGG